MEPTDHRPLGWRAFAAIFLVALGLRSIHYVELDRHWPLVDMAYSDVVYYLSIGRRVARGDVWGGEQPYLMSPGYGFALGGYLRLRSLVGAADIDELRWIRRIQMLLAALGCALLGAATARIFDRRSGILAGLGAAAYGPLILFDGELMPTSPFVVLICASLWAIGHLAARERSDPLPRLPLLRWAGVFVLLGTASAIRMNIIPWAGLLALWAAWLCRGRGWKAMLALVIVAGAAFAAPIIPVAARNKVVADQWGVALGGWPNVWLTHNPKWDETSAMRAGSGYTGFIYAPPTYPDVHPGRWADWFRKRALRWIFRHPGSVAHSLAVKGRRWVSGHERRRNIDVYDIAGRTTLVGHLIVHPRRGPALPFALLLPLTLLGLAASGRDPTRWIGPLFPLASFLLVYSASVYPFIPTARYRIPIAVAMLPFAALGLQVLAAQLRARQWRGLLVVLALVAFGSIERERPSPEYEAEMICRPADAIVDRLARELEAGHRPADLGARLDAADADYVRAARRWPTNAHLVSRRAEVELVRARASGSVARLQAFERAEALYTEALKLHPWDWQTPHKRGQLRMRRGATREALADYHDAAARRPELAFLHTDIARCHAMLGRPDLAYASAQRAIERHPQSDADRKAAFALREHARRWLIAIEAWKRFRPALRSR